jgi:hypothetical protein
MARLYDEKARAVISEFHRHRAIERESARVNRRENRLALECVLALIAVIIILALSIRT